MIQIKLLSRNTGRPAQLQQNDVNEWPVVAGGRGAARAGGTGGRDNSESTYFVTSVDKM